MQSSLTASRGRKSGFFTSRFFALAFMVTIPALSAFPDTSFSVTRSVYAQTDSGLPNCFGSIAISFSGTEIRSEGVVGDGLSFRRDPNYSEENSGTIYFDSFASLTLTATSQRNDLVIDSSSGQPGKHKYFNPLRFVFTLDTGDGSPVVVGQAPATYLTYDDAYNVTTPLSSLGAVGLTENRDFTLSVEAYWDWKAWQGYWHHEGPMVYHFVHNRHAPSLVQSGAPTNGWTKVLPPSWNVLVSDDQGGTRVTTQLQYAATLNGGFGDVDAAVTSTFSATSGSVNLSSILRSLPRVSGIYRFKVTATDSEGVSASFLSSELRRDVAAPVAPPVTLSFGSSPERIVVSWGAATDADSGLKTLPYTITSALDQTPLGSSGAIAGPNYSISFADVMYGKTLGVTLTVEDGAGNVSSSTGSITIPPKIALQALVTDDGSIDGIMKVSLQFNLTAKKVKESFSAISVSRNPTDSGVNISLAPLVLDPKSIPLAADGTLIPNALWKLGSNDNLCYVDSIEVLSGAGHKEWTYAPVVSPWIGTALGSSAVALPNHRGNVTVDVEDMNGHKFGSPEFGLDSGGIVNVILQGSDPDQDTWYYDIDRVVSKRVPPEYTAILKAFRRLSGSELTEYSYRGEYGRVTLPVRLTLGTNNIQVFWREGLDGTRYSTSTFSSDVVSLVMDTNGLKVSVKDEDAEFDERGLVTHPGEPLDFEYSAPEGSDLDQILWDFGDGTTGRGSIVKGKVYRQAPDQSEATYPRTISVILPGEDKVSLPLTVVDTQEGALYVSEIWRGDHTVLGKLTIPQTLSLTLKPNQVVTLEGSPAAGYEQGFIVDGNLLVEDSVTFQKPAKQTLAWGTILVNGVAAFGLDDIVGADRGITVASTGVLTLQGTRLHENKIGLHVVGSTGVLVTDALVTGNTLYGIKEDQGGRPVLTRTRIAQNFRNYYSYDRSLLDVESDSGTGQNQ